jgi:hypothetical protein
MWWGAGTSAEARALVRYQASCRAEYEGEKYIAGEMLQNELSQRSDTCGVA